MLRFRSSTALVDDILQAEATLDSESEELSRALYNVVGAHRDSVLKPSLVGLRRAIHNRRLPHQREWNPQIEQAVGPALTIRIGRWHQTLARRRELRDRLPGLLSAEFSARRSKLRELASDPAFRRGLSHSSATLLDELDKWLKDAGREPQRAVLFRLAKYLARAASKTSPYSTFTVMGEGRWVAGSGLVRLRQRPSVRGVLELNDVLRETIVAGVHQLPGVQDSLRVRVNPSAVADGQRLTFLGKGPTEPLVTVPTTATLQYCLRLVAGAHSVSVGEMRERLIAHGGQEAAADRYLTHLLHIGLLEVLPQVEASPSSFSELACRAAAQEHDEVAKLLNELESALNTPVGLHEVDEHLARNQALRHTSRQLLTRLSDRADAARRPATDDDATTAAAREFSPAMDTAVAATAMAECGATAWRPVMRDLEAIRKWLAVFDYALPPRLALADWWSVHLPVDAEVPFVHLHRMLQDEIRASSVLGNEVDRVMSPRLRPAASRPRHGRWAELERLRTEALAPFRVASPGPATVQVEAADLERLADTWPTWVTAPESLGCYVQPLLDNDADRDGEVVVNTINIGHGKGRSRVAKLIDRAGGTAAPVTPARQADVADLGGPFGYAVNDRLPGARLEIDYPFATNGRSAEHRLPLGDLVASYDQGHALVRLTSRRLGRPVRVVHLGMLAHSLLPPAARLLVGLFGPNPPTMPATLFIETGDLPPQGQVCAAPRLLAGVVVLRRAQWRTAARSVPSRGNGESDADYLLRMTAWRRGNGIPSRCFLRLLDRPRDTAGGIADWMSYVRKRKPVYVDFSNWFLVLAMSNMLRSARGMAVFEEALPDPGAPAAQDSRAVEVLVEVNADGGGYGE